MSRFSPHVGLILVLTTAFFADAQRPPARVNTVPGEAGKIVPESVFQGSVYYAQISDVAAEVDGKVDEVRFDEGDAVSAGEVLVELDRVLLEKELAIAEADLYRYQVQLEAARTRLARVEGLIADGITSVETFDTARFNTESSRAQVASAEAQIARLSVMLEKKTIYAPFDGIVVDRDIEPGEWRSEGDTIAVIARSDVYDVIANVPETILNWIEPDMAIPSVIAGEERVGTLDAVIPRGDIATRTFSVKVRLESAAPLLEGMSAAVRLPQGAPTECVLLPRDAIIRRGNTDFVYRISDKTAQEIAVDVVGYDGNQVGVTGDGVDADGKYVMRGHARLQDGATVSVEPGLGSAN